jgi:hypothetical protein
METSLRVELDDQLFLDVRQIGHLIPSRDGFHLSPHRVRIEFQPGSDPGARVFLQVLLDEGELRAPLPDPDLVALLDKVGWDGDGPSVHGDVCVGDKLPRRLA